MNDELKAQAQKLFQIAEELEKSAQHAKIAAGHFNSGEVPRACAHTLATEGHIHAANDLLKEVAKAHSLKSRV
jgi:ferritin